MQVSAVFFSWVHTLQSLIFEALVLLDTGHTLLPSLNFNHLLNVLLSPKAVALAVRFVNYRFCYKHRSQLQVQRGCHPAEQHLAKAGIVCSICSGCCRVSQARRWPRPILPPVWWSGWSRQNQCKSCYHAFFHFLKLNDVCPGVPSLQRMRIPSHSSWNPFSPQPHQGWVKFSRSS